MEKRWMTRVGPVCIALAAMAACRSDPGTYAGTWGGTSGTGASTSYASSSSGCDLCSGSGNGGGFSLDGGPPAVDHSPVTLAATPPPALSGGTMLLASDGVTAVAADPDRDTIWWTNVDVSSPAIHSVVLQPGDEPGRVVQDGAGLVHVALRGSGAVVTLDFATGKVVRRTGVCPAPRGLAYDPAHDTIVVACVGGELVSLAAADDTVVRVLHLESDLRDVVALGSFLAVSKLRTAQVLLLDAAGAVRSLTRPPTDPMSETGVAWRMIAIPGAAGVAVAHQRATRVPVDVQAPQGYADKGSLVSSVVTLLRFDLGSPDTPPTVTSRDVQGALPVDVALDAQGTTFSVAVYGSQSVFSAYVDAGISNVAVANTTVTSVAVDATARRIAFVREPAAFVVDLGKTDELTIPLPASSVLDTGHDLFHLAPQGGAQLACASCHPEGRDDGRVWQFKPIGSRRTPSLVGHLLQTAPFHWDGDQADIGALMLEVFTKRMGGMLEDDNHVVALARFLDAMPRIPITPPPPSAALNHGQALFESPDTGCTGCHSGPRLTNNLTVDVGTGKAFQVPSLTGVGLAAPYLHDGCAATLADRFGSCGGGDKHGHTSQLTAGDIADLSLYLGSL